MNRPDSGLYWSHSRGGRVQRREQASNRLQLYRIGLPIVLVSLVFLLGLQYVWLRRLERAGSAAAQATLHNYVEAVGESVEYFYRSQAERLLNVPPEIFSEGELARAAKHWSARPYEGVQRLWLVDFTKSPTGNYFVYEPESQTLVPATASDESLAMILSASPWQMRRLQSSGSAAPPLRVDEMDPAFRIIFNPIADDSSQVLGIAGMILDQEHFRQELLPAMLGKALRGFFPHYGAGDIAVTVRDGSGALVYGEELTQPPREAVISRFAFVFTDWSLGLHRLASAPEAWARTNTALNMLFSVLLAAALMGGILLSLRGAERVRRLSEMKSDFVSNVSHELRTPLASIRVFAELLRTGRVKEERVRQYGEYIEAETRRLSRLIENILDFSRIESGRKSYQFVETDLAALVADTVTNFRLRANAKDYEIDYKGPADPLPPMLLDDDAIGRSLDNLLENALKYSGDSRWIGVRLEPAGDRILIHVADRGLGIPKEEQQRIFERFHRAGQSLVHDVKGSGLGLAIVHHVMQAHRGQVTVASEPGKGSTFTLHLPAPDGKT